MRTIAVSVLVFLVSTGVASAQQMVNPHGLSFTLDPVRTEPGTIELEVGTSSGNSFDLPWIFKFTADAENPLLHDMEWAIIGGVRGGPLNLSVRRPVYRSHRLNLAVSPRLTIPIDGVKPLPGLALLASFPWGLNSFTVNGEVNQTSGETRRAIYGDYARTLGKEGLRSKVVIFSGIQAENAGVTSMSTGEGVAYRCRPNIDIQVAFRQLDLLGERRLILLTGLVLNIGKVQ